MIKKGIILAGGKGTRMSPLTKAVNKHLLPIYDKPLIFYPLSILMLSKIKDILIIVNKGQLNQYKKILPNGNNLGIKITYKEQKKPIGLPDAFDALSLALSPGVIFPLATPFDVGFVVPFFKLPDFCNLLVAIAYAEFLLNPLLFNWLTSLSIIFGIMKF